MITVKPQIGEGSQIQARYRINARGFKYSRSCTTTIEAASDDVICVVHWAVSNVASVDRPENAAKRRTSYGLKYKFDALHYDDSHML